MAETESRRRGVSYRPGAKAINPSTVLGMLDAGVGITVLPRSMAQHNALTPRVALPIAGPPLKRRYGILAAERREMSAAARSFCAVLKAEPFLKQAGPAVRR